jgi:hypothetical protein
MKIRRAWIRVTAAAAIATIGGPWAAAQGQYAPYPTAQQYPYPTAAQVAPYGAQQSQPSSSPVPYPTTAYQNTPQPSNVPAAQDRYATTAGTPYASTPYQPPRYQQPAVSSPYASLARQMNDTTAPGKSAMPPQQGNLPTPDPAMSGDAMSQGNLQGYNSSSSYPTTDGMGGYLSTDPGSANGNCGYQDYGYDACMDECDSGSGWFGGVYGLYMTRSRPDYRSYTVGVDSVATGTPYYPQASDTENQSDCALLVPHWRGGVEVRLGCTFGIGDSCDYGDCGPCDSGGGCDNACGCQPCSTPCCQQMYAWEVAWWGIEGDVQQQFVDGPLTPNFRYYGMINYAGLEYDDGGGAAPVNDYYNYQIPITGLGAETVLAQRVRTNFWAQNFELNILRLPLYSGGCGCDCAPAFSMTGLCGVRYFRTDDDLEFGTEWDTGGGTFDGWGNGTNELFHDINMENNLVGFQLGANMNYSVATRWNFFWDTNFGVYNNYITQHQRLYNPLVGDATFAQDGRDMDVDSNKDDIAFLGEMRLGGGYMFADHWRATLAYRAIGISGVALAPEQIQPQYTNWADTARIHSDGSIVIHGIQAGVECVY